MFNRDRETTREQDAETFRALVEKYRQDALDAGYAIEDVRISDALIYLGAFERAE